MKFQVGVMSIVIGDNKFGIEFGVLGQKVEIEFNSPNWYGETIIGFYVNRFTKDNNQVTFSSTIRFRIPDEKTQEPEVTESEEETDFEAYEDEFNEEDNE